MQPTYSLPSEVTVYMIGEIHPQCLAWLGADAHAVAGEPAADGGLRVDAHAVAEVDAAGVQLLLSLSNALARQQRALVLVRPSVPLIAACKTLGAISLVAHAELTGETL